jgi:predicted DNA binding CopG/RHH family protein
MKKKQIVPIDLAQLQPMDELDSEEAAIHLALQTEGVEWDLSEQTKKHYAKIFRDYRNQRRAISLRIPEGDFLAIRAKAAQLGLPYQSLINALIHQYVTNSNGDRPL